MILVLCTMKVMNVIDIHDDSHASGRSVDDVVPLTHTRACASLICGRSFPL